MRLIATDLDGTLLNGQGEVSSTNQAALRAAHEAGLVIVVATGRPSRWLDVLDPIRDLNPIVIASNGAVEIELETGRVLNHDPVDTSVAAEVVADLRAIHPSASFAVEQITTWSRESDYPWFREDHQPDFVGPIEEAFELEPVLKLLVKSPELPSDELADLLDPVIGDRMTSTWSFVQTQGMLELSRAGVSKASALTDVIKQVGVTAADCIAFGDMPNDIEMLKLVGRPFAMSNAHESVLALGFPSAGDHHEDGVGNTIAELLRVSMVGSASDQPLG